MKKEQNDGKGILFNPNKDYKKDWHWWDWAESWWHRYFWNWFSDIPRNIKYFFQKGMRGWSDSDLWDMHHYITETILNMLVELKAKKHGYPSTQDDKGEWDYDEDRWNSILNEIIDGFAILRKVDIGDEHLEYAPAFPDDKRIDMESHMREHYPTWRFVTREEEAKVKRAFELLLKYYYGLWD